MATGAAGDGLLRGMFDACISGGDMGIQRRPYHRNCGCALHDSRRPCSHDSRSKTLSYPIRRSWSESCLTLIGQSSPTSSTSPAAPPEIRRTPSQALLVGTAAGEDIAALPPPPLPLPRV